MHKVISVTALPEYKLKLVFSDDVVKIVDLKPYIGKGISEALINEDYFQKVALESGGLCWPNGYDFCPIYLYKDIPEARLELA